MLLGALEVFSRMDGFEVIHVLVDEFRNRNFGQIAMRFVANQPHRKNIAQRRRDQMRIFADEQLEASGEILICGLMIHKGAPISVKGAREICQRQSAITGCRNTPEHPFRANFWPPKLFFIPLLRWAAISVKNSEILEEMCRRLK